MFAALLFIFSRKSREITLEEEKQNSLPRNGSVYSVENNSNKDDIDILVDDSNGDTFIKVYLLTVIQLITKVLRLFGVFGCFILKTNIDRAKT